MGSPNMFTGIIQETGTVSAMERRRGARRLRVEAPETAVQTGVGDSVCVDGVCLTATSVAGGELTFDVGAETLDRTTLGDFREGRRVNLEAALRVGDRLGGHFVSGHVDGIGTMRAVRELPGQVRLEVAAGQEIICNLIQKGSVAVDGVSLTIAELRRDGFEVSLIPHTLRATTLQDRAAGDRVNLECDMIGRWVRRLLGDGARSEAPPSVDMEQLKAQGF